MSNDVVAGRMVSAVVRVKPSAGSPTVFTFGDPRPSSSPSPTSSSDCCIRYPTAEGNMRTYEFDAVVPTTSSAASCQSAFYNTHVRPSITAALAARTHATVLAYGQTGSGKTYTMHGGCGFVPSSSSSSCPVSGPADGDATVPHPPPAPEVLLGEEAGVVPRAIYDAFFQSAVSAQRTPPQIRVSFVEVYNETFRDLLLAATGPIRSASSRGRRYGGEEGGDAQLRLRLRPQGEDGGVPVFHVQNLTVYTCESAEEAVRWFRRGAAQRAVRGHAMNARSSRSHALFTLYVDQPAAENQGVQAGTSAGTTTTTTTELTLVDLAGSERLDAILGASSTRGTPLTAASGGQQTPVARNVAGLTSETSRINRSLMVLGRVIDGLAALQPSQGNLSERGTSTKRRACAAIIPYRESKLTCLLRHCLAPPGRTVLVACADATHEAETVRTFDFASRARRIDATAAGLAIAGGGAGPVGGTALVQQLRLRIAQLETELHLGVLLRQSVRPGPADGGAASSLTEEMREMEKKEGRQREPERSHASSPPTAPAEQRQRHGDHRQYSEAEVHAAVVEAREAADRTLIAPLTDRLFASCEQLDKVVQVNRQLRAAMDAAASRAAALDIDRRAAEEENVRLRERVDVLQDLLLWGGNNEEVPAHVNDDNAPRQIRFHRTALRTAPAAATAVHTRHAHSAAARRRPVHLATLAERTPDLAAHPPERRKNRLASPETSWGPRAAVSSTVAVASDKKTRPVDATGTSPAGPPKPPTRPPPQPSPRRAGAPYLNDTDGSAAFWDGRRRSAAKHRRSQPAVRGSPRILPTVSLVDAVGASKNDH